LYQTDVTGNAVHVESGNIHNGDNSQAVIEVRTQTVKNNFQKLPMFKTTSP
jgi:hypothetical protein